MSWNLFSFLTVTELVVIFISTVILAWWMYFQYCFRYWKKKGVPTTGSYSFPFGDLSTAAVGQESIYFRMQYLYNYFRQKGHIHGGIYYFNGPVYFPIDPEMIKRVLVSDFEYFVDRGMYMNEDKLPLTFHLFNMNGDQWKNVRNKLTPAFTSGKMKSMYHIVQKYSQNLLEILKPYGENGGSDVDMKEKFTRYTTDVIGSCAFGIDCNSMNEPNTEFVRMVDKIFNHPGWKLIRLAIQEGLQNPGNIMKISHDDRDVERYFTNLVKETIEYRDKNNYIREDFLNILMQMRTISNMSFKEIVAQSYLFFTAGFETSSATMGFCLHELAYQQDLQDRLRQEVQSKLGRDTSKYAYEDVLALPFLDKAVKETLRKYPAVGLLNRICVKPYHVPGTDVVIDPGTPVLVSTMGVQRNPDFFKDPDVFNPDRFDEDIIPFTFLPFGEGPRNCIGLRFGLMQTKLGLATLINHFKFYPSKKSPKVPVIDPSTTTIVLNVKGGIYLKLVKV